MKIKKQMINNWGEPQKLDTFGGAVQIILTCFLLFLKP